MIRVDFTDIVHGHSKVYGDEIDNFKSRESIGASAIYSLIITSPINLNPFRYTVGACESDVSSTGCFL